MRAERGSVRGLLLVCLAGGPAHGYDLIRQIERSSGGAWTPSPGSVYPALMQLEDEGLVTVSTSGDKKVYTLTAAGRVEAKRAAKAPTPWEPTESADTSTSTRHSLRDITHAVHAAARQVGTEGNPEQIENAVAIMRSARQQLYRLLAED